MSKLRLKSQKKIYNELEKRINLYTLEIEKIFDKLNYEASRLALTTSHIDGEFLWDNYLETKRGIEQLQLRYVNDIGSVIYSSTSTEWANSNLAQSLIADKVLKTYTVVVDRKKHKHYYENNLSALKAFQSRKDKGMNLSAKLWKQSEYYKNSLEAALSLGIERGISAVTLSKRISQYLNNFDSLKKDYKEKYGNKKSIYDCQYHSARLARTEINMAYRSAEQLRWSQFDFVVGYEVKLSNNHNCKGVPRGQFVDICDYLAGKYPKDFKFSGWHPNCRCYTIPILNTENEFNNHSEHSVNEVNDVPEGFKQWIEKNKQRAKNWETVPYFIKDNSQYISKYR